MHRPVTQVPTAKAQTRNMVRGTGGRQKLHFADEILIIDSFSTDATLALAKKHRVKVVQRAFDDFSSQKNYAIDLAKHEWIYILDADERVTAGLKKEILNIGMS